MAATINASPPWCGLGTVRSYTFQRVLKKVGFVTTISLVMVALIFARPSTQHPVANIVGVNLLSSLGLFIKKLKKVKSLDLSLFQR
tara:strand:+ start:6709 stop:6966 length:258 start_codon:yes stop_codon:yes gene_type:complete